MNVFMLRIIRMIRNHATLAVYPCCFHHHVACGTGAFAFREPLPSTDASGCRARKGPPRADPCALAGRFDRVERAGADGGTPEAGIKVVPWTTNDPDKMRAVIRMAPDGLISDRPDLLQKVLAEERASSPELAAKLKHFDVQGHRGGRNLHPENTLPAFEGGHG